MKKGFACLMTAVLLLCLLPAALAAPARDVQALEIPVDGKLQALLDTLCSAAVLRGVEGLPGGETPGQPLVEGMASMALMCGTLPEGSGQKTLTASLSHAQMNDAYAAFFTSGTYETIDAPICPCITAGEDSLSFDLMDLSVGPFVNAHVYRAEADGETVRLLCDLYPVEPEDFGRPAQEIPMEGFSWLCGAEICVQEAPDTPFGYTVSAFSLSPDYAAGELASWQTMNNTEYGYTVQLPRVLGLSDETAACLAYETADSTARLTIQSVEGLGSYEEALQDFLLELGDETLEEHREMGYFTAVGSGIYEMVITPEHMPCGYLMVFVFPPEYQAEYTLYAELIRNSFMVWEAANG